ncbi:MAG: hypothetical protein JW846_06290 [Dehalococcoidia bacterium]|nr:hypothetical protein [Dehalococcoidia bacterium]
MPYKHTQTGWVTLAGMAAGLFIVGVAMMNANQKWISVGVMVLLAVAMVAYSNLTVTINDDTLEVRFGPGFIRRQYRLRDIESSRAVRNPFFYGWGTRLTPHGWLYNVSGFDAVEVEFKTAKKVRIGTDEPQSLESAIQEAVRLTRKRAS